MADQEKNIWGIILEEAKSDDHVSPGRHCVGDPARDWKNESPTQCRPGNPNPSAKPFLTILKCSWIIDDTIFELH